jgi:hypothetical protein
VEGLLNRLGCAGVVEPALDDAGGFAGVPNENEGVVALLVPSLFCPPAGAPKLPKPVPELAGVSAGFTPKEKPPLGVAVVPAVDEPPNRPPPDEVELFVFWPNEKPLLPVLPLPKRPPPLEPEPAVPKRLPLEAPEDVFWFDPKLKPDILRVLRYSARRGDSSTSRSTMDRETGSPPVALIFYSVVAVQCLICLTS